MKTFLSRQLHQIQTEGVSAVRRKFIRAGMLFLRLILVLVALPVVLLIRVAKPVIWIRFGPIRSDVIGHFINDTEYYLSWREVEGFKFMDFFFYQNSPLPNEQWALMVERSFKIHPVFRYFSRANQIIPGGKVHLARSLPKAQGCIDPQGVLNLTKPHIHFTEEENDRGREALAEMGVERDGRFVCLNVRDSAFKNSIHSLQRDWSYHDYRNTDIDSYEAVALDLATRGVWVLRMGKIVEKPFLVDHPRIIDYSNTSYRSDFLDIWLMAHCHFAITTGTGLDEVNVAFRRDYTVVNLLPVGGIRSSKFSVVLFKNLKSRLTGEMLGLREQISTGIIRGVYMNQYQDLDLEIIDNTPEEILDTVCELVARLDGSWIARDGDEELQERFWSMIKEWDDYDTHHGEIHARVCTAFLRKNHKWFLA
jgi:putative glycosyltransferase (TIGR04372 family)